MRKFTHSILLMIMFVSAEVHGQAIQNFGVGYNLGIYSAGSINNFIRSYNDVNDLGKNGLSDVRFLHGISLGYQFRINHMYGEVGYGRSFFGTSAKLDFGDKRHMKMRNNEFTVVGGGIIGSGNFRLNIGVGMAGMTSTIHLYTRQRDGSISYGTERLLNGSYSAIVLLGIVKVEAEKQFSDRLALYGGLQFGGAIPGTIFAYNDDNIAKGALSLFNKGAYQLPEDYAYWLSVGPEEYTLQDRPYAEAKFTGITIRTGIRYTLK